GGLSDDTDFVLTVDPVNDGPVLTDIDDQTTEEEEILTIPIFASDIDGDVLDVTAVSDSPEDVSVEVEIIENVTDIDGNVYEIVPIGEQMWMKENLRVTHYNDGSEIPTGYETLNGEWSNLTTGAYAVYDDDPSNGEIYGNLYNWYAVDDERGVCPEGWNVPTDDDYTALSDYLGGTNVAGGKMKEEGFDHWNSPNTGATNESGFTGLPGGYRVDYDGSYNRRNYNGYFWTSTEDGNSNPWSWNLGYNHSRLNHLSGVKRYGFSVRCIRDETRDELVNLILTPSENFNGNVNIDVTVSDGYLTDSDDFTLTVTPVNDAPVIEDISSQVMDEDATLDITLIASDVDENDLSFSAESDNASISV
ncbi:uncharacterized protein METZ01_LOCUS319191, partial [marine metagenome]